MSCTYTSNDEYMILLSLWLQEIADFPDVKSVKEETALAIWSSKLQTFWNSSPYYYEGVGEAAKSKHSIIQELF